MLDKVLTPEQFKHNLSLLFEDILSEASMSAGRNIMAHDEALRAQLELNMVRVQQLTVELRYITQQRDVALEQVAALREVVMRVSDMVQGDAKRLLLAALAQPKVTP